MPKSKRSDWTVFFDLSRPCLYGQSKDSKKIQFDTYKKNGKKWVRGFNIVVENSTQKVAIDKAEQMALRLTNLITAYYNAGYVWAKMSGSLSTKKKKLGIYIDSTKNRNREIKLDLNLDHPKFHSLLKRDSRFNQQLAYFSRGIKASEENDPITMIKEFYQVFNEEHLHHNARPYKSLRDVLSHARITNKKTKEQLKENFPNLNFDFRPSKVHLDTTSTKNLKYLRKIADELKTDASFYMWKIFV